MRKHLALCAFAASVIAGSASGAAADETGTEPTATKLEQVSAYTEPSVVYIAPSWSGYVYDTFNDQYLNDGQPFVATFQCTGFVVNPDGYIATAGHCVDPEDGRESVLRQAAEWTLETGYYANSSSLDVETVMGFDLLVVNEDGKRNRADLEVEAAWGVSAGGVETGKSLPARVIKAQTFEKGDGAILKVEATDLNAIPLSDDELSVGTEVVSIGYPGSVDLVADASFSPTFKEGSVSQERTVSDGLLKVYEVSAAVSGGMSGGPTVNLEGEVVAFNSFGIDPEIETQSFNFVRPAATVRELLADAGSSNEISDTTQRYRAGLDALFSGDKETAVENLQAVVDEQPTNEFAKKYLDMANELPDPPKSDSGGFPWMIVVIGLVAVLAAGGGLVAFLMMKRKKSGGAAPMVPTAMTPAAPVAPAPMSPVSAGTEVPENGTRPGAESDPLTLVSPVAQDVPEAAPQPAPVMVAEQAPVAHNLFCGNCGNRHEAGQKFCKECGSVL